MGVRQEKLWTPDPEAQASTRAMRTYQAKEARAVRQMVGIAQGLVNQFFPKNPNFNSPLSEYSYHDLIPERLRQETPELQKEFFRIFFQQLKAENAEAIATFLTFVNNINWFSPSSKVDQFDLQRAVANALRTKPGCSVLPYIPVKVVEGNWLEMRKNLFSRKIIDELPKGRIKDMAFPVWEESMIISKAVYDLIKGAVKTAAGQGVRKTCSEGDLIFAASSDAIQETAREVVVEAIIGGATFDDPRLALVTGIYAKGYWPYGVVKRTEGRFKRRMVEEFVVFEPPIQNKAA